MPQGPIPVKDAMPSFSSLNLTAAAALKSTPGSFATIIVVKTGTAGSLTINDSATVAGANAANTIFTALFSALTVGQILEIDVPCFTGVTVSAVPTASQFTVTYN